MASHLTRESTTASNDLPRHLIGEFEALTVSAALGCHEPDFLATADRLVQEIVVARPDLSPARHRGLEVTHLSRAAALVFPADSARLRRMADESDDYLWQAQKAALVGDTAFVRSTLLRIGKNRGPGRGSPDALYPEAVLWLAIGDSMAARRWLDGVLLSPGWLTKMIDDPVGVASFMRCFALRAQIATPSESVSRLRWARIVATLWANSDPGPSLIAESASRLVRRAN